MKSDLLDCMHSGELLLGASAVLVLLIIAGSLGALILCHLRPDIASKGPLKSTRNQETNVTR